MLTTLALLYGPGLSIDAGVEKCSPLRIHKLQASMPVRKAVFFPAKFAGFSPLHLLSNLFQKSLKLVHYLPWEQLHPIIKKWQLEKIIQEIKFTAPPLLCYGWGKWDHKGTRIWQCGGQVGEVVQKSGSLIPSVDMAATNPHDGFLNSFTSYTDDLLRSSFIYLFFQGGSFCIWTGTNLEDRTAELA